MKKSLLPILTIGLMTYGCNAQTSTDFKTETEKWKKELHLNGEVGPPCSDNAYEWSEKNKGYYFGMQEIQSMESDFNKDGVKDGLFYFPAQNCVGGSGIGSDFAMLVYSNDGELLTNKNITKTIEQKIKGTLAEKGLYGVYKVIINYKGLGKTIIGKYNAWGEKDANCCPSFGGTFEYNPVDFSIIIENKKNI
ncbi:hypothetical protein [Tenacibaculum sp. A30]|uniref:hypothetical protein n=1 Tax=Tenacibaculum sp. A30 TaxID=3442644 RepID=UPI003EC0C197